MFCPNCGANNSDSATVCAQCKQPIPQFSSTPQAVPPPQPPSVAPSGTITPAPGQPLSQIPNYLTQSIVMVVASCLCCLLSLPFSIIALVNSNQVNSKIAMNDIAGAMSSSKNAKLFNWIALGMVIGGALLGILWFIFVVILGASGNIFNR